MRTLAVTLLTVATLGGCGYKAALYLPEPRADAKKPPTQVVPAPDRPVPAQSAPTPK